MAQKKTPSLNPRDYEGVADQMTDEAVEAAGHNFVLTEDEEKPQPVSLITPDEQELRDLKSRFKKLYGYKPVGVKAEELRGLVETAEHRQGLKRDGIL